MFKNVFLINLFSPKLFIAMVFAVFWTLAAAQVEELEQDQTAQDQSELEQENTEDANSPKPKDDQQVTKPSKPSTPNEVFIPSEELSEDTSAPFPVDI